MILAQNMVRQMEEVQIVDREIPQMSIREGIIRVCELLRMLVILDIKNVSRKIQIPLDSKEEIRKWISDNFKEIRDQLQKEFAISIEESPKSSGQFQLVW